MAPLHQDRIPSDVNGRSLATAAMTLSGVNTPRSFQSRICPSCSRTTSNRSGGGFDNFGHAWLRLPIASPWVGSG
jgi:hypothetical protein